MRRKISRLFFHVLKFMIGFLVYINSRLYMKSYVPLLRKMGLKMNGTPRFIAKSAKFDDFDLVSVGDRLVVSSNVIFLTHDYSFTTALISLDELPKTDIGVLRQIIVGDNVFIGMNSMIMPGSQIGNNVVVGAGSVVRGSIPDNNVVSGNPAEVIMTIQEYANKIKNSNYKRIIDKE